MAAGHHLGGSPPYQLMFLSLCQPLMFTVNPRLPDLEYSPCAEKADIEHLEEVELSEKKRAGLSGTACRDGITN